MPETARHASSSGSSLFQDRRTWRVAALWWGFYGVGSGLVLYLLSFSEPGGPWPTVLRGLDRVTYSLLWFVATMIALWMSERFTITRPSRYGRIALHLVVSVAVAIGWAVAAYYINLAIVPGWLPLGLGRMLVSVSKNVHLGYASLLVLMHAIIQARRYRAREVEALQAASLHAEAQLQVLKMEMQPHFLFNALHSISALMMRDVQAANEMLVLLSDMLRRAVDTVREQEVPLAAEIETVQLYLQIEQVRFRDRLSVAWDIDPDTLTSRVPHMLLQPLIENAIKHGIGRRSGLGLIEISTRRDDRRLVLQVRDNGEGIPSNATPRQGGLGLSNTRKRLIHLYGGEQSLVLANAVGGGVVATVCLPFVSVDRSEAIHGGQAA